MQIGRALFDSGDNVQIRINIHLILYDIYTKLSLNKSNANDCIEYKITALSHLTAVLMHKQRPVCSIERKENIVPLLDLYFKNIYKYLKYINPPRQLVAFIAIPRISFMGIIPLNHFDSITYFHCRHKKTNGRVAIFNERGIQPSPLALTVISVIPPYLTTFAGIQGPIESMPGKEVLVCT